MEELIPFFSLGCKASFEVVIESMLIAKCTLTLWTFRLVCKTIIINDENTNELIGKNEQIQI